MEDAQPKVEGVPESDAGIEPSAESERRRPAGPSDSDSRMRFELSSLGACAVLVSLLLLMTVCFALGRRSARHPGMAADEGWLRNRVPSQCEALKSVRSVGVEPGAAARGAP